MILGWLHVPEILRFAIFHSANMAIAKAVANSKEGHAKLVTKAVSSIVRASSFRQMLSGFFAAGGVNAMQYVGRKISKAWQSR